MTSRRDRLFASTMLAGVAVLSGGQASWGYDLPSAAASATLTLTNAAGQTVWSGPAPQGSEGKPAKEVDYKGTPADPAALQDFLGHFRLCGGRV